MPVATLPATDPAEGNSASFGASASRIARNMTTSLQGSTATAMPDSLETEEHRPVAFACATPRTTGVRRSAHSMAGGTGEVEACLHEDRAGDEEESSAKLCAEGKLRFQNPTL